MSVWSVLDICKKMTDVSSLLSVRMPFASSNMDGYMAMAGAMATSICNKIQGIKPLAAAQAVELYKATSSMQLCDELKALITKAIDECVSCQAHVSTSLQNLMPQSNIFMYNYMTQNDWNMLNSQECTYWSAINVVATRLRLVGVKSLKEDTKKWCTALLLHCFLQKSSKMPPYKMIYQLSQDLSQAHASCITQTPTNLSCPAKYPEKPHLLGLSWVEVAYAAEEPPVEMKLDNLTNLVQFHTPIRATSKLLNDASVASSSQKSALTGDTNSLQQIALCFKEISKTFASGVQNQVLAPQQQSLADASPPTLPLALPALPSPVQFSNCLDLASVAQQFKPTPRLRLSSAKSHASDGTAEDEGLGEEGVPAPTGPNQPKTLEEYENETFEGLKQKKVKKAANVMKRPAAHKVSSASAPSTQAKNKVLELGCPRCRGNTNGCSTCRNPAYNGVRLHGKTAWEAHGKLQKQKHFGKTK